MLQGYQDGKSLVMGVISAEAQWTSSTYATICIDFAPAFA